MKTERNNLFTYKDLPEKEKRNLAIFDLIRKKGLISKPEISKATGINIVSVSNYIENYIAKKLISEKESGVSSGGRKPELIELNKKDRFVVGVDVGLNGTCITLADLEARPVKKSAISGKIAGDLTTLSANILSNVEDFLKKSSLDLASLGAIGLAVFDGRYLDVAPAISKRLGIDVFIGGAAQCAAFGERWSWEGHENEDLLYIHSDLGRGIFIKGSECFGAVGANSEIGSIENTGTYAEGDNEFGDELNYLRPWSPVLGVVASARAQVSRGIGTKIVDAASGSLDNITVSTVISAAKENDKVASDILKQVGTNLGVRIAYLINALNPKIVIIGGGIESAGDIVLDPIKSIVNRYAFTKQAGRVKIRSGVLGADAVCVGAASLAVREIFLRA
ncbi:MAG: ROK family protein [Candidatus Omnitrophica bacterium]|nr:ROK family protein [Candidatus Omnitrophota bacterium]